MREKEIAYILSYLYNNELRLEEELRNAQTNLRYRRIDTVDCHELALLIERYNTFKNVSSDIRAILKIFDKKGKFNYD